MKSVLITGFVILLLIFSSVSQGRGLDIPSCTDSKCHGDKYHTDCGDCHGSNHHKTYPTKDCFECHGDSVLKSTVGLHHNTSTFDNMNCTYCHKVYTIQSIPYFPEQWRECDNCHDIDHHDNAQDKCAGCHAKDKDNDQKCINCHKSFPIFKSGWDHCDSCHSANKHSHCDDCHSGVNHHDDVSGMCSTCHEGGRSDGGDSGKSGSSGSSGKSDGSGKSRRER